MSAPATSAVDMSHPVEDATTGTEVTTNGTSSSSPSSTSPPSAQHPPADSEPVSSTATPMAQPDPNEVPPRVVSDLPTRPVSVPPGPVVNGHAAAVASSASPSLPTQPRPTTAPVNRPPPPAGQGQPLPPAFDEKLPLFGVLKTRIIHPPAPQPPIPQPGPHPTLVVQPQHPQPQYHQQPQPQPQPHPHHQAQSHQQSHQHPHPHSHPHPHHPQQALPPPPPVVPSSASPPVANAKHVTNAAAFNDEYAQLSALLRRSSPGAVRRVVRDNWEKCLLGTEFHTTFVTNVAVHHASGGILQRALGDFGGRLVQEGTTQIANLLTQKQLDDVFTILLPKMSDRFLDAAVSYRLPSIPAQRLLNHLARAERLGYDANDIEEEADEPEPLIPATMSAPRPSVNPPPPPVHQHAQTPTYTQPTQQGSPALQPPRAAPAPPPRPSQHQVGQNGQASTDGADTPFTCSSCHKTFIHEAAFRYHHRKAVCKRDLLGPLLSQCPFCYKGFASDGGLSYHLLNNVCGVSGGTPNDLARTKRSVVDASKASSSASSPALMTPQSTAQAPRQTPVPVPVMGSRGIPGPVAAMSSSPAGPPPIQSDLLPGFHQHYAPPATPTPPTPNDQALRAGAHLEPAQRAAMEAEMRRAEDNLKNKIDEAKRSWDPADLERRLSSLRNSHATKQSQIRKKYGIRLRTRRGPSAMIEERLRVGLPADLPAKKHATPGMADGMTPPPNGSQALNTNGKRPLYSEGGVQPSPSPSHPPVKKLAVSELTGGLGGTSATAAMQDPTAAMSSQDNSGYYTSTPMNPSQSHFAGSSQRIQATPQRIQMGVAGRGILREEPVDVESSSDSGSDIEAD